MRWADAGKQGRRAALTDTEQNTNIVGVMTEHPLRAQVRTRAEDRPGVYRWIAGDGRVLYVGKSVRVRSRLLSYFRERGGKLERLVRQARGVAWDYAPNEFSALWQELRLIRRWRPEYNVEHKRGRRYGFVKITREPAPRLLSATGLSDDGALYYGPFARASWLSQAVRDLAHAIGLRDCPGRTPVHFGDQRELFGGRRTPLCARADLGTCPAPCAGRGSRTDYDRRVATARAFLEARSRQPLEELARSAEDVSARSDFEYAAELRARLARLRKLRSHLLAFRGRLQAMNLVYPVAGYGGEDHVYIIRRGRLHSEWPAPAGEAARRRLAGIVSRTFRPAFDDRHAAMSAAAAAEVLLAAAWFARHPEERQRALDPREWLARNGTHPPPRRHIL